MFDLGLQELIIIFLVALLVFGPNKMPELGRTLGKWFTEIKNGINNAKMKIDEELGEIEETAKNNRSELSDNEDERKKTALPEDKL
ncbi:MAG: hypothetical protein A2X59_08225 [Nitrospirae bacterium GWC2_42_7]|nr:MAG: hypothetical protein A2X59_08225 [Nitrospirae bacterium GWC2_42_7]